MSDTQAEDAPPSKPRRRPLMLIAPVLVAGIAGFAVSYLGVVSPAAMLAPKEAPMPELPEVSFVDVPRITVPLAGRNRQLSLTVKLETDAASLPQIELLMPRISDSFTRFLSDIDPSAFDRRGVLDIIREELRARAELVLGDDLFTDLLITEFSIE